MNFSTLNLLAVLLKLRIWPILLKSVVMPFLLCSPYSLHTKICSVLCQQFLYVEINSFQNLHTCLQLHTRHCVIVEIVVTSGATCSSKVRSLISKMQISTLRTEIFEKFKMLK